MDGREWSEQWREEDGGEGRKGDGREGKEGWKEGVVGRGKKRRRKELRETGMMRSSTLPLK